MAQIEPLRSATPALAGADLPSEVKRFQKQYLEALGFTFVTPQHAVEILHQQVREYQKRGPRFAQVVTLDELFKDASQRFLKLFQNFSHMRLLPDESESVGGLPANSRRRARLIFNASYATRQTYHQAMIDIGHELITEQLVGAIEFAWDFKEQLMQTNPSYAVTEQMKFPPDYSFHDQSLANMKMARDFFVFRNSQGVRP